MARPEVFEHLGKLFISASHQLTHLRISALQASSGRPPCREHIGRHPAHLRAVFAQVADNGSHRFSEPTLLSFRQGSEFRTDRGGVGHSEGMRQPAGKDQGAFLPDDVNLLEAR